MDEVIEVVHGAGRRDAAIAGIPQLRTATTPCFLASSGNFAFLGRWMTYSDVNEPGWRGASGNRCRSGQPTRG